MCRTPHVTPRARRRPLIGATVATLLGCGEGVQVGEQRGAATADGAAGGAGACVVAECLGHVYQCGDCLDNDGDGQTDYEDSECCDRGITLRASQLKFKAQTKRAWQRLQFKTVFGPVPPASLDPMSGDTSLQIGDEDGQLFCATIESEHWLRIGPRAYGFRKRLADAPAGLTIGRLNLDRRGAALFETQGWIRPLAREAGEEIHATLRMGGLCVRIVDDASRGRGPRGSGEHDDD